MPFFKQRDDENSKALPQTEREAIVDLLHLCLYADAHIALKEGELIADVVETIGWDNNIAFSSYESRSIASARAAKGNIEARTAFIGFAAERLKSPHSRALAVDLCAQLVSADGSTAANEHALLGEIRRAMTSSAA